MLTALLALASLSTAHAALDTTAPTPTVTVSSQVEAGRLEGRRVRLEARAMGEQADVELWLRAQLGDGSEVVVGTVRTDASADWAALSLEGVVPEGTVAVTVGASVFGDAVAWIDEVGLAASVGTHHWTPWPMENGSFERGRKAWTCDAEKGLWAIDKAPGAEGSRALRLGA